MPESTPKMLPGSVIAQAVKCGKASCKCARGEPHTAFYRYWTEGGRQRKAYVRGRDLEKTGEPGRRWPEADAAKPGSRSGAGADAVRAEMRSTLREALGAQVDTPGGQRELRRLRSRGPGAGRDLKPDPPTLALSGVELKMFRF